MSPFPLFQSRKVIHRYIDDSFNDPQFSKIQDSRFPIFSRHFPPATHVKPAVIFKFLGPYTYIHIKSFHQYVDDSHARFPEIRSAEKFMEVFNRQDSNIKCTIEVEDESKQIDFLDVRVINNREGN